MCVLYVEDRFGQMVALEITESIRFWLKFINIIDMCINCIGLANVLICMQIIYKRPLFHQHLVLLLLNGYAAGVIILICGVLKCVACLVDFSLMVFPSTYPSNPVMIILETIRACAVFSAMFSITSVVLERLLATIKLQSYERTSNLKTLVLTLVCCWILGLGCFTLCFVFRRHLTTVAIWIVLTVFSGISFRYAFQVNLKRLKESRRQTTSVYGLSQRYQLSENIRVFRMLLRCNYGSLLCFVGGLTFVGVMLIFTDVAMVKTREYIIREGLHIIVCTACNILSFCSITGTYVWRQMLMDYLKRLFVCRIRRKNRVQQFDEVEERDSCKSKTSIAVRNTDGIPLAFNAQEEADIYFKQLHTLWT